MPLGIKSTCGCHSLRRVTISTHSSHIIMLYPVHYVAEVRSCLHLATISQLIAVISYRGYPAKGPYLPCVSMAVGPFWQDAIDMRVLPSKWPETLELVQANIKENIKAQYNRPFVRRIQWWPVNYSYKVSVKTLSWHYHASWQSKDRDITMLLSYMFFLSFLQCVASSANPSFYSLETLRYNHFNAKRPQAYTHMNYHTLEGRAPIEIQSCSCILPCWNLNKMAAIKCIFLKKVFTFIQIQWINS